MLKCFIWDLIFVTNLKYLAEKEVKIFKLWCEITGKVTKFNLLAK